MSGDPVQEQVDAHNRHDVEAFLACYAADAEVRLPDGTACVTGVDGHN